MQQLIRFPILSESNPSSLLFLISFASPPKKKYVELAQKLKYYGYLHFESCLCDYPEANSSVMISVGGRELLIRNFSSVSVFSLSPSLAIAQLPFPYF